MDKQIFKHTLISQNPINIFLLNLHRETRIMNFVLCYYIELQRKEFVGQNFLVTMAIHFVL